MPNIHGLGIIVNGHWQPGIGDPTLIGWLTTALYFIATGLCGIYAWRANTFIISSRFRHRLFWWSLFAFMLFLAINKQLDIQSWLMLTGRHIARAQGWYSYRETVRMWFITGVAISGFVLLISLGWIFRYVLRDYGLTLTGIMLIIIYIIIRAGAHHIQIIGWDPGEARFNWILEIGGIILVGLSAALGIFREKKNR